MFFKVRQPFLRFIDTGNMTDWHPPQGGEHSCEFFKPLMSLSKQLCMGALVNICFQILDAFPDRQIKEYPVVIVRAQVGCISSLCLKSPNKPRA